MGTERFLTLEENRKIKQEVLRISGNQLTPTGAKVKMKMKRSSYQILKTELDILTMNFCKIQ